MTAYQPTTGDVVQNTTVSFTRDYPNHTGVVESVQRESNGWFVTVEYTVEVESMSHRAKAAAKANGRLADGDDYYVLTVGRVPARSLREIR